MMRVQILAAGLFAFVAVILLAVAGAESPTASADPPKPVEDDMHEFMEYAFQPTYRRLKEAMAATPADNAGWKAIKADALLLAEGGNLLLLRTPAENPEVWREHSVAVRELGGKLYQAGKTRDFPAGRKHYEAMLKSCNRCHDEFADGEHQLAP
ncbi:MAG: hypothetical protein KY475_26880 [Planctomycetes bacterium]|nr:hypothetical protein [Planctomycetota bacterium]